MYICVVAIELLKQAVDDKHLRVNPSEACKLPKVKEREMLSFEDNQVLDFLKAIEGHPYEYLYKITLFTGLREGEVLGLTWDCLDLERGTLIVKQQIQKERKKGGKYYFDSTKNSKDRTLVLAPSIVELFRLQKIRQDAMRAKAGDKWVEHNMVFTRDNGFYFSSRTAYNAFKCVVEKMGIPDTRFHDLRHSYTTMAIKNGDDVKTVQKNLGHATAAFTLKVYAHVTEQMKRDSADRMEQFMQSISA